MIESENKITLDEICQEPMVTKEAVVFLVEQGIVTPQGKAIEQWIFDVRILHRVKKACRLHNDLGIDWNGVALAIDLIEKLEWQREENKRLRQQLKRFIDDS